MQRTAGGLFEAQHPRFTFLLKTYFIFFGCATQTWHFVAQGWVFEARVRLPTLLSRFERPEKQLVSSRSDSDFFLSAAFESGAQLGVWAGLLTTGTLLRRGQRSHDAIGHVVIHK